MPQALYTDWKNVYVRVPNAEERVTGAEPLTQFGRMCATLGIQIIPASSPQAKGRIERNHGTQQDRLVKKLRRRGIADVDDGEYLSRDGVLGRPQCAASRRRRRRRTTFTWRGRAGCASTPCFGWRRRAPSPMTGSCAMTIASCSSSGRAGTRRRAAPWWSAKTSTGTLEIRYRDRVMRWTEIAGERRGPRRRRAPPIAPPRRAAPRPRRVRRYHPSADHPWHKRSGRAGPPTWQVRGPMKRLWKLPEPWTRRTRAHRSLENYRTVFHELPQASSSLGRGHFYRVKNGDISNES